MLFSIVNAGNVGNRMLMYMMLRALARRLAQPVSINIYLPEWGLAFDQALHERIAADAVGTCWVMDKQGETLEEMAARIVASGAENVVFIGFFQRAVLYPAVEICRELFPLQPLDIAPFAEDEIVINIRAGDILKGDCSWYPLVPPMFYKTLAEHTGLRPVLLGQLEDSLYLRTIRHVCPQARLLPSAGAMLDFNRLRHAKNLCITVSTFSWLAAWLSQAVQIHYPLLGFLHPFCLPPGAHGLGGVDLTPQGDERYRYHLFPLLNADAELAYLEYTARFNPLSLPVPAGVAAGLSAQARRIECDMLGNAEASNWYVKKYPAAAWSIAWGHYPNAAAYQKELGRLHGYGDKRLEGLAWRQARPNLALGKPALQSSVSPWSRQRSAEGDAAGAVNGEIEETYGFHTAEEDAPWWRVDLQALMRIEQVWVFNRIEHPAVAGRSARLAIDVGASEDDYVELFRREMDAPFGGVDGRPLVVDLPPDTMGRFVRIRLLRRDCLHLSEVEVYGSPGGAG